MPPRKSQSVTEPVFPPDRAIALLTQQLEKLQLFKGRRHSEVEADEEEWQHLTETIIQKAFDSSSANPLKFENARLSGRHIPPTYGRRPIDLSQPNFENRIKAFEPLLKVMIKELELSLPDKKSGVLTGRAMTTSFTKI